MKIERLRHGYRIRLNDSEFAALEAIYVDGYAVAQRQARGNVKLGMRSFFRGLVIAKDRRNEAQDTQPSVEHEEFDD